VAEWLFLPSGILAAERIGLNSQCLGWPERADYYRVITLRKRSYQCQFPILRSEDLRSTTCSTNQSVETVELQTQLRQKSVASAKVRTSGRRDERGSEILYSRQSLGRWSSWLCSGRINRSVRKRRLHTAKVGRSNRPRPTTKIANQRG